MDPWPSFLRVAPDARPSRAVELYACANPYGGEITGERLERGALALTWARRGPAAA